MDSHFVDIGLGSLDVTVLVAQLGNKLLLNDNLERNIDFHSEQSQRTKDIPMKVNGMSIFMFCLEGTISIKVNFHEYVLERGSVIIIQNGSLGEFHGMSDDVRFMSLFVDTSFYEPYHQTHDTDKLKALLFRNSVYQCSEANMQDFLSIYLRIREWVKSGAPYAEDVVKGYLQVLLFSVYSLSSVTDSAHETGEQTHSNRSMQLFDDFVNLVLAHYRKEHFAPFYADKLCITPRYLSQVVNRVSGKFVKDYIKECLILDAKVMLKSGCSITDICDRLHFPATSFFTRYFKEATGFTPTEYQRL